VFVVGAHHPLGDPNRAVNWTDLRGCRWITPMHGSPAFATLIDTLGQHDAAPAGSAVESSSLALNIALIRSGDFVAILPISVARPHAMRSNMPVLPLAPLEPLGEIVAYWRSDLTLPAAQLFSECLREAASELLGELVSNARDDQE